MNFKLTGHKFGLWAEFLAVFYLRCKFYRIVYRRKRNYGGEIDIIAIKKNFIVFIEVKARSNKQHLRGVLTHKQRTRILNAAQIFLSQNQHYANLFCRFDLILITPFTLPVHILNAWGENY